MDRREWLKSAGTALVGVAAWPAAGFDLNNQQRAAQESEVLRMHLNENPYGPSPRVFEQFADFRAEYGRYPGGAYQELTQKAADFFGVLPEQVMSGNGSGEMLCTAGHLGARNGKQILSPYPSYGELAGYARQVGAESVTVPLDAHLQTDLDAMKAAITSDTGLIYLCNPANPTGVHIPIDDLLAFARSVPENVLLFVDEAYSEFATADDFGSMLPYLNEFPNLIVTRTLSKAFGLAGFRIGFAFAGKELLSQMSPLRTTYVSAVAVRAGIAALDDKAWLDRCVHENETQRRRLTYFLQDHGHRLVQSQSNFIFYETGIDAAEYRKMFGEHRINTGRPFEPYRNWCRLTIPSKEGVDRFIDVYNQLFNG